MKSIPALSLLAWAVCLLPGKADPPRSVEVPLYHLIDNNNDHRLGIYAALGGSSERKIYELDTGSTGLYAADNRAWWPEARFIRKAPSPQSYGSGVSFEADIVETSVDFGGGAKVDRARVGRITRATGENLGAAQWNQLVLQDEPPLHSVFFGNMGSGLEEKNLMVAVLAQMPGNLATGFVVETRGIVLRQKEGTPLRQGRILIGLTDEIRSRFEIRIPMRALSRDQSPVFLPSGFAAREEYPIKTDLTLSAPGAKPFRLKGIPALLDSGAPSTTIYEDKKSRSLDAFRTEDGSLRVGVEFSSLAAGSRNWRWAFETGKRRSVDLVSVGKKSKKEVNLGTATFFQYDVMFDIERGELGLHRIPVKPRIDADGGDRQFTSLNAIRLHGQATSPAGITSVQYRLNGEKRLRKARGTAQWSIWIPIRPGYNWVRIKATNRDGQTTWKKVAIYRRSS